MADRGDAVLVLRATGDQLAADLQSAAGAVQGMGGQFQAAANRAGSAVASISEKLREHRSEHVQTARAVGTFTKELDGLFGKGSEVSGMLAGLAGGLAIGGGLGLGIEAVKLLAEQFARVGKEQRAWLDDADARIGKVSTAVGELALKLAGVSPEAARWSAIQTEILRKQAEITRLEGESEELRSAQMAAGGEIYGLDSKEAQHLKERVEKLREEAAQLQKKLDLEKAIKAAEEAEKNKAIQAKGADEVLEKDRKAAEKAADEKRRIQGAQLQESLERFAANRDAQDKLQAQYDAKDLTATAWLEEEKRKGLEDAAKRAKEILDRQAAEQETEAQRQARAWKSFSVSVANSFASGFTQALFHAKSLEDGLQSIFDGILSAFEKMIEEMIAKWLASQIFGFIGSIGGPIGSFIGSQVGSGVASLDVGAPRVPRNMLAVIHRDEAVLTVPQAEAWRSGQGGGGVTVHLNFPSAVVVDRRSIEPLIPALRDAVREASRNGRWDR